MIFRALYRSKLRRLFGEFVPEDAITEVMSSISEWSAFKLLMPFRIGATPVKHSKAMTELQRTIERSLAAEDRHRAF